MRKVDVAWEAYAGRESELSATLTSVWMSSIRASGQCQRPSPSNYGTGHTLGHIVELWADVTENEDAHFVAVEVVGEGVHDVNLLRFVSGRPQGVSLPLQLEHPSPTPHSQP